MEELSEFLKNISIESLMDLSKKSEALTFEEDSIVRSLIYKYITSDFFVGLISFKVALLTEINRRYFGSLK